MITGKIWYFPVIFCVNLPPDFTYFMFGPWQMPIRTALDCIRFCFLKFVPFQIYSVLVLKIWSNSVHIPLTFNVSLSKMCIFLCESFEIPHCSTSSISAANRLSRSPLIYFLCLLCRNILGIGWDHQIHENSFRLGGFIFTLVYGQ